MHYLKFFLTKPFYLVITLLAIASILWLFYKRGKLNKKSVINIWIAILITILSFIGFLYWDGLKNKHTNYVPARIIDGKIVK